MLLILPSVKALQSRCADTRYVSPTSTNTKVTGSHVSIQQKMSPPGLPKGMTEFTVTQVESQSAENTKAVVLAAMVETEGAKQGAALIPSEQG